MAFKGKAAPKPGRKSKKELTRRDLADRLDRFCREYMIDANGRRSAEAAGFSKKRAVVTASELLCRADVQAKLDVLRAEIAAKAGIDAQTVLKEFWAIHKADPRELIDVRRECCRYCYGKGNRYQRTPREMEEFRKEFDAKLEAKAKKPGSSKKSGSSSELPDDEFDNEGGIGWNPRLKPNKQCPECFGAGQVNVYPKDVRDLRPEALVLLAGVKQTQHGLEIKTRDQDAALANVGRIVGAFKDSLRVQNPDKPAGLSPGELELQEFFAMVNGADIGPGPSKGKPPK